MAYKIVITDEAKQDLVILKSYIIQEFQALYSAHRLIRIIKGRIYSLSQFPKAGQLSEIDFLAKQDIRVIHAAKYRIYYIIDEDKKTISVLSILHHLQDTPSHLK